MGILNLIRHSREIARLRKQAQASPSPASFCRLAERCIAVGRIPDAQKAAREGRTLYPESTRLADIEGFAVRHGMKRRIAALRREVSENPSPQSYGDLAQVLLETGDEEQALRISDDFARRFPLNERPHLIMGEIRLRRFFRDMIPQDGLDARLHLKRTLQISSDCERGRILLGHLYFAVGDVDRMKRYLADVPDHNPEVAEFLLTFDPADIQPEEEEEPFEEDLPASEWIRAVEARGRFLRPPEEFGPGLFEEAGTAAQPAPPPTEVAVERILEDISEIPGVTAAAFLTHAGVALADRAIDPEAGKISSVASDIVRTAEEAGRRMDVGTFEWCTVEGDFGGLTITKLRDVHLAARFEAPLKAEQAPRTLELAAERLYAPPPEVDLA